MKMIVVKSGTLDETLCQTEIETRAYRFIAQLREDLEEWTRISGIAHHCEEINR